MSEIFGKDALFSFVNEHYGIEPDYPFSDDASAVLRHPENRKWFALVMRVSKSKFGNCKGCAGFLWKCGF